MRITHRMIAGTVNHNLQRSLRRLELYSNQLSTGLVFQKASENPVGVGRVMGYSASINRNEQYRLNMNQTSGWLQNTESALKNGLDVLQRVRELCINGANEHLTAEDRRAIAPEIREFIDHMLGIANTETNGLYIFGGHQTLSIPYKQEKIYHDIVHGGGLDREAGVVAEGLQNGHYTLGQSRFSPPADEEAGVSISQTYLQGSAESIIGEGKFGPLVSKVLIKTALEEGSALEMGADFVTGTPASSFSLKLTFDEAADAWHYTDESGSPDTIDAGSFDYHGVSVNIDALTGDAKEGDTLFVNCGVSASVVLEVTGSDYETGEVSYRYLAHQYTLDGAYEKATGEFKLTFGASFPQSIDLGAVVLDVEELEHMNPFLASGLKVGDRSTIKIKPALGAGENYDLLTFGGSHRGGEEEAEIYLKQDALTGKEFVYRSYSLETFSRNPELGTLYDGSIKVRYDSFAASSPALTFSYDKMGFPVYYGDQHDRLQEISPHQEMMMNISGDKAFGDQEEIFAAVYEVYWALVDNDREALGHQALENMELAVDHFLARVAEIGARSNRVDAMNNTLSTEKLYLREVRSNIEDIDLAELITDYLMQENAYRAALSTASMMLQPSLVDYLR